MATELDFVQCGRMFSPSLVHRPCIDSLRAMLMLLTLPCAGPIPSIAMVVCRNHDQVNRITTFAANSFGKGSS
jgi:hypothetical protein